LSLPPRCRTANHDLLLRHLDVDGDGMMSRGEHHIYMVARHGFVTDGMMRQLDAHFQRLAGEGTEKVAVDVVHQRRNDKIA